MAVQPLPDDYDPQYDSQTGAWTIVSYKNSLGQVVRKELVNMDSNKIAKIKHKGPAVLESYYIDTNKHELWNTFWNDYVKFKKEFPINTWKLNEEHYGPGLHVISEIDLAKFTREFPINTWKLNEEGYGPGLHVIMEKNIAKFKHEFPINVWKLEDRYYDKKMRLSIIYEKDIAKFKVTFPDNIWRFEGYKDIQKDLSIGCKPPEILGAFANSSIKNIIMKKQTLKLGEETFRYSNLEKIKMSKETTYKENTFPKTKFYNDYTYDIYGNVIPNQPVYTRDPVEINYIEDEDNNP